MAIARFLDRMCLALRASGLWLRYATLQNLIPSFPWIVPPALHPGTIQGKEGIKSGNTGGGGTQKHITDLPAYSDTVYSDTPLTVTLLACPK